MQRPHLDSKLKTSPFLNTDKKRKAMLIKRKSPPSTPRRGTNSNKLVLRGHSEPRTHIPTAPAIAVRLVLRSMTQRGALHTGLQLPRDLGVYLQIQSRRRDRNKHGRLVSWRDRLLQGPAGSKRDAESRLKGKCLKLGQDATLQTEQTEDVWCCFSARSWPYVLGKRW